MRFLLGVFKFIFGLLIVCAIAVALILNAGLSPVGPGPQQKFTVTKDESGHEIAQDLQRRGLIRNAFVFQVMLRLSGKGKNLVAGEYMLSPGEDPYHIMEHMVRGESIVRTVTFTEGQTAEQMAAVAEKAGICKASDYLAVVRNPPAELREGVSGGSLEGFLFPDTYDIDDQMTAQKLIEDQIKRFDDEVLPVWSSQHTTHLTLRQVVILASLVEREAQVPEERPLIAGVLTHRLKVDMPLQCDATIQYALGRQKAVLSYADLKIESPYNTYTHLGLPPGPIGNPGLSCIKAAIAPTRTPDLYYVRNDVKNDGSHVFARTLAEHNANIKKYQK